MDTLEKMVNDYADWKLREPKFGLQKKEIYPGWDISVNLEGGNIIISKIESGGFRHETTIPFLAAKEIHKCFNKIFMEIK
jgi:hypothetical protein